MLWWVTWAPLDLSPTAQLSAQSSLGIALSQKESLTEEDWTRWSHPDQSPCLRAVLPGRPFPALELPIVLPHVSTSPSSQSYFLCFPHRHRGPQHWPTNSCTQVSTSESVSLGKLTSVSFWGPDLKNNPINSLYGSYVSQRTILFTWLQEEIIFGW